MGTTFIVSSAWALFDFHFVVRVCQPTALHVHMVYRDADRSHALMWALLLAFIGLIVRCVLASLLRCLPPGNITRYLMFNSFYSLCAYILEPQKRIFVFLEWMLSSHRLVARLAQTTFLALPLWVKRIVWAMIGLTNVRSTSAHPCDIYGHAHDR